MIQNNENYENEKNSFNVYYPNINKTDKNILNKVIFNKYDNNLDDFFCTIGPSYYSFENINKYLNKKIQKNTNKIKEVNLTKNKDKTLVNFELQKIYIAPTEYFYLLKPNTIQGRINYNSSFDSNEMSAGIEYNQRNRKRNAFIQYLFPLKNNKEFSAKYNYSKKEIDFKRKSNIYSFKFRLNKNLNERSVLFRDYLLLDPIKRISVIFSHENISNFFDEVALNNNDPFNSVNEIMKNLPEHDNKFNVKFLYEKNYIYNQFYYCSSFTKYSIQFTKSLNSVYNRNRIYIRRLFNLSSNIQLQFNLDFAFLLNLKNFYKKHILNFLYDEQDLKIHEKLIPQNFKGILNPCKKFTFIGQNKSPHLYMLGNCFYSLFSNKIIFKKAPFFNSFDLNKNGFEISPFVHLNTLFSLDDYSSLKLSKNIIKDFIKYVSNYKEKDSLRISSGLGVTIHSKLFNFEVVYTPYVKKTITDLHTVFSLKLGID